MAFSLVLVFSIVVFAYGMIRDRPRVADTMPREVWRYVISAIVYLSLAGLAGLGLGYGVEKKTYLYYFLIHGHVHLSLLGWVGMGMTGAVLYIAWLSGKNLKGPAGVANHLLMHAAMISMLVGIYLQNMPLRASAGVFVIAAMGCLLFLASASISSRSQ